MDLIYIKEIDSISLIDNEMQEWYIYFCEYDNSIRMTCQDDKIEYDVLLKADRRKQLNKSEILKISSFINKNGEPNSKTNYKEFSKTIADILLLTQDEIDKTFGYNENAVQLYNKYKSSWGYREIYNLCKKWNNDIVRVDKYLSSKSGWGWRDNVLIDIFPSEEDLKNPKWSMISHLLHVFYDHSKDTLYKYINEAIEKFPNDIDDDYREYYVRQQIRNEYKNKF